MFAIFFFLAFAGNVLFCGTAMLVLASYLERFRVQGGSRHALMTSVFWGGFAAAALAELFLLGTVNWQAIGVLFASRFTTL